MEQPALFIDLLFQDGVPAVYQEQATLVTLSMLRIFKIEHRVQLDRPGQETGLTGRSSIPPIHTYSAGEIIADARRSAEMLHFDMHQLDLQQATVGLLGRWVTKQKRLPVLVVRDDYSVFHGGKREEYVFGATEKARCATVSTFRYERDIRIKNRIGLFALTMMHELGHLFGAPSGRRNQSLEDLFGWHCTNTCIMRQRDDLPDFERDILPDFKNGTLFCGLCTHDIRNELTTLLNGEDA